MENRQERDLLFGKYELGRLLGQGTFAKVYFARTIENNEVVAVKVLNKAQIKKEGLMDQIKREISIMGLVKHPNVVELKEVMATKSKIFFAMEYVKGGELFAKVAKGKIKEDAARKYFQQLISAVDYCHSRGVSHRDLKPENLLLDEHENLKVSDFGLSALPEQHLQDGLLHTRCGTPAYVAPEVLRKNGYNGAKADIWSCGVILYVLLAGFLPFQDENIMNMYRKVFKAEFEFPPWFSSEVRKLIKRLLVVDPAKRITIAEIMEVPWFKRGYVQPKPFYAPNTAFNVAPNVPPSPSPKPESFNAFDLISALSSGIDLSGFFKAEKKSSSLFTSKCSAFSILCQLEGLAKGCKLKVSKVKDFKLMLQRPAVGRNGPLAVTAEVFELAPSLAVVEFSKTSGDALEYNEFCDEVRPVLKDIVWTWQGENPIDQKEKERENTTTTMEPSSPIAAGSAVS